MNDTLNIIQTTQEVADRFNELAQQEKWFEIQDELFADDAKSIEPPASPYFKNAEGKTAIRAKGEEFLKHVTAAHELKTSGPIVTGNHFAVGRTTDIDVNGFGRVRIDQIMLYEVKDGKIISEQFFY
ncbi:nuclear transport factor 2 family protein [Danxiaibacter flavus]|uniref:Nuclear transport factor 2 family protein n=1 Tax=Danxiaibacter flavus TaxID=3049108 RepID=A0ABV3Z964_9BACT|nr:nuclear transport factor 2 family protein [Chitinophagaceae bacterium DXS]